MKSVTSGSATLRCDHIPRPGVPALLLLNSLGASLEMWDDQLDALGERFELIRYDVRGHGESSSGDEREVSIVQLARDALAVMESCGIARAHLCGISMGGMTAMYIASHWPDHALRIVLANTSPHMPPKENWQKRIDTATTQGMTPLVEAVLERWFTADFRSREPTRVDRIRQMLLTAKPDGYAACCAALRDLDLRDDIKRIGSPTLVIGGAYDTSTPLTHAEQIANSIPDSKLITLEAAHLSNVERAAEFARAVTDFLGGGVELNQPS